MLIDPSGNPNLPFTLYAAECEGDVPTRQGKINKLIKTLRALGYEEYEAGYDDLYDLTASEIEYINSELSRWS